jgi:hypothetical protein
MVMAKADPIEQALDRIGELRRMPLSDSIVDELRRFLRHRSNLVMAKAAKLTGETGLKSMLPDLLASLNKLMTDAPRLDKRCAALTAIVTALYQLDCDDPEPYLRGLRHVQKEGSVGPPIDTAASLRGLSAQGLLRTRQPDALHQVLPLLIDPEPPARLGAIRALATNGGEAGVLLLKLKVLTGDPEPEVLAECFAQLLAASSDKAVQFVAQYVDSEDPANVEAAIFALGESRLKSGFAVLTEKWSRTIDADTRKLLLTAIASSRLEEAIDFLLSIVTDAAAPTAALALEALAPYRNRERVSTAVSEAVTKRKDKRLSQAFELHFNV